MFCYDYEPDIAFEILYMDKLLIEHGYQPTNTDLDQDFHHEAFFEALHSCAENSEQRTFYDDNDGSGYEHWYFYDSCITDYFELSNEYSKRKHIRYKNNPYIKKIVGELRKRLNNIHSYNYDWDIRFSPKKGYKHHFLFAFDYEFYAYLEAIEAIIKVFEFFKNGVKELKKDLGYDLKLVEPTKKRKKLKGAA